MNFFGKFFFPKIKFSNKHLHLQSSIINRMNYATTPSSMIISFHSFPPLISYHPFCQLTRMINCFLDFKFKQQQSSFIAFSFVRLFSISTTFCPVIWMNQKRSFYWPIVSLSFVDVKILAFFIRIFFPNVPNTNESAFFGLLDYFEALKFLLFLLSKSTRNHIKENVFVTHYVKLKWIENEKK